MAIPNISGDMQKGIQQEEQTAPRGLDEMVRLLNQAKIHKQNGNKSDWAMTLKEFKLASDNALLAEKKKNFQQEQKNVKIINEKIGEIDSLKQKNNELLDDKEIVNEIVKLWREGKKQAALQLMMIRGKGNEEVYRYLSRAIAIELENDPRIKEWLIRIGASKMNDKERETLIYDSLIKPQIQKMETPDTAQKVGAAAGAQKGSGYGATDFNNLLEFLGQNPSALTKQRSIKEKEGLSNKQQEKSTNQILGIAEETPKPSEMQIMIRDLKSLGATDEENKKPYTQEKT